MNNALLYLGGLLVVTLAALFAVPHFVDWNGYRGVFEEEATKVLGRDVRVGGAVNVRFLPTPYVRFEKVRLADPTGQTGEPFVRVDSFTMRLSGPALLRGVLEANEIELYRPVLTLALDNQGGGNWTSIQIKPGALPFVPQDVALHSVKIIDGVVALYNSEAQSIARAEAVNGEFSADALKGPFRFKGQAQWSGELRDVKFATTVPDAAGAFQVKANVKATGLATSYALDGRVEDLSKAPRLTGELAGMIPLSAASAPTAADAVVLELKSRIDANTAGAKIDDISLALESAAEPQLITGAATAVWGTSPRLDIALTSKWLDLDRLAGAGQDGATFVKVKQLGLSLMRSLAGDGAASAKIDVDQVKLGGETAGSLKIDAARQGGAVHLSQLKVGLPGGSRLDLSGDVKDDGGKVSFAGSGFVHGSNLARLLGWAAKSGAQLDIKADGAFAAEGRVLINDTRLEFTEASADIGGRAFSGDVVVSGEGRRKVSVTLEGARLDSSELFPDTARALDDKLRHAFGIVATVSGAGSAADAELKPAAGADTGDISVRVLAGELKHGNQIFRNVDATVGLDGGNIRIPSAKFTTASGLAVSLDARIQSAGDQPVGVLAYDVVALTPDALKDLAGLSGFGNLIPADRIAQAGSAKLAGLVHLGARGKASTDVTVDGTVQSARISAQAEFDGGLRGWRSDPSRFQVAARAQSLDTLLAAFAIEVGGAPQPGVHEAELVFASTGAIGSGTMVMVDVSAPDFEASYSGRVTAPADAPVDVAGTLRLKSKDVRDTLAIAGVKGFPALSGLPIDGRFEVERTAGLWSVATRALALGSSKLTGTAKLTSSANSSSSLTADLRADNVTVAGLLAALLDKTPVVSSDAKASIWPEAVFNFDGLANVTSDLRVSFGTLQIDTGVTVHDGQLKIASTPEKFEISELSGRAARGILSGALQLSKSSGGIALDSHFKIDGAELADLNPQARGKAVLEAKVAAQAQSPAALISTLSGDGTLTLESAALPGPGPAAATGVITAVMANKLANEPDDLATALKMALTSSRADLGNRAIAMTIAGGTAKLDTLTLDGADGAVSTATVVDLTSLAMDSAWKLAGIVPPLPPPAESLPGWVAPQAKGPLPPASIVYTGALGDLAALSVSVDATDMQRELAVRQIERNVEELERLKRQDEYRVRMELERRQAVEAERTAAAAAAAAAKASGVLQPVPAQVLPPVLPESSGATGATAAPVPAGDDAAAQQGAAPQTVTIEAPPITPAGEKPSAASTRPQPARVQPSRPTPARRTTSDEVMRSLGGFP